MTPFGLKQNVNRAIRHLVAGLERLWRLRRLSARDWRLLLIAAFWGAVMRAGIGLFPFKRFRQWAYRRGIHRLTRAKSMPVATGSADQRPSPERVGWAVMVADRCVPRSTCLSRALACELLLAEFGYVSSLRIGAANGGERRLEAHAWVEVEGQVVVGGQGTRRYTLISGLVEDRI